MRQVACGAQHSVVLTVDFAVYSWGLGSSGALGHGKPNKENFCTLKVPTEIENIQSKQVLQIACGDYHTFLLSSCGDVYSAGWEDNGRLGRTGTVSTFLKIELKQIVATAVACGGGHTAILSDEDRVYCWGENRYGQVRRLPRFQNNPG